ncbi:hypothetical protein ACU6ZY_20315 [Klebsiella aerogenes]
MTMKTEMTKSTITDERITSLIERMEHFASNLKWTYVRGAQDLLTAADGLRELQERRKPLLDKDLQGVLGALEHPAGINAAGKQVVRSALVELQERRKVERDTEPVTTANKLGNSSVQGESRCSAKGAPALDSSSKNAKSRGGNSPVNDAAGKPLTIALPPLPVLGSTDEWYQGFAAGAGSMREDCASALAAAGLKVV